MKPNQEIYLSIHRALADSMSSGVFAEHVQPAPVQLNDDEIRRRESRIPMFQSFFETTLQIFKSVIEGRCSPFLSRLLLNDVPNGFGIDFHRGLPNELWTIPRFFRTDESKDGTVFEIQCPGSGWGDLQLLANLYARHDSSSSFAQYQPSSIVASEIVSLCGKPNPAVLHLLDNASNPSSMRYLMATTQPPLRYWGCDPSVRNGTCDFVRSHSFFGLVAENLFNTRVREAQQGRVRFDLPPILVFDQKAPLCLPFLQETRSLFGDQVRDMLAYSYPISADGFVDSDGTTVAIAEFLVRPPSQRRYFLKYAGCDTTINWGSRAVFRLDDNKAHDHLTDAVQDAQRGRYWLIQPEVANKETVTFPDKTTFEMVIRKLTAKYSCFYGPTRLVGIRTMHRPHFKVHGQEDTVIGMVVPGYRQATEPKPTSGQLAEVTS